MAPGGIGFAPTSDADDFGGELEPPVRAVPVGRRVILALDPGLASFGAAVVDAGGCVVDADVLSTEADTIAPSAAAIARRKALSAAAAARGERRKPQRAKIRGGAIADRDRRAVEIWTWIHAIAARYRPVAFVAESPGGGKVGFQAAIATASASLIAGIAAHERGVPMIRVTVQAWRRTFVPGERKIADEDLYAAIGSSSRAIALQSLKRRGRKPSLVVHALDSIGMGRWAVDFSPVARRALGIATSEGL